MLVESRSFFGPLTRVTKKIWPFGMAPLVTYRSFDDVPGKRLRLWGARRDRAASHAIHKSTAPLPMIHRHLEGPGFRVYDLARGLQNGPLVPTEAGRCAVLVQVETVRTVVRVVTFNPGKSAVLFLLTWNRRLTTENKMFWVTTYPAHCARVPPGRVALRYSNDHRPS